ncbi:MAG TPA: RICIN domain-containing protein, partial [Nitrospiraceae bacterium]|nr:RICIN domain-containing protein [Nitrospiraceae bacterium]
NRHSGKALDVYNLATNDGAIAQWTRNDGAWQQWQFVDSGGGYYRLRSRHSAKVLDVYNWSTADSASIVQWADTNGANQQFRLVDSDSNRIPSGSASVALHSSTLSPRDCLLARLFAVVRARARV